MKTAPNPIKYAHVHLKNVLEAFKTVEVPTSELDWKLKLDRYLDSGVLSLKRTCETVVVESQMRWSNLKIDESFINTAVAEYEVMCNYLKAAVAEYK